jgi:tRNA (cytidine56-2'-O)-methyltransferase
LEDTLGLKKWRIYLLRLNHRPERDKRVTTHLFLAARALGVDGAFYSGKSDKKIENSVEKVKKSWGGSFKLEYVKDWRKIVKEWKELGGEIVHLTMYGLPIQDVIKEIRGSPRDKLVIVGGAKVPAEAFQLADWNVSITSQPHSEVSALSIFLHELFEGQELRWRIEDGKIRVVPNAKGKKVVKNEEKKEADVTDCEKQRLV